MSRRSAVAVIALSLSALATSAAAQPGTGRQFNFSAYDNAVRMSVGHPNELSRWHGMWAYDNGRHAEALEHFQRAAKFGDKFSQHFLSLMHWHGEGVPRDPVQAYIWADLAAERGNTRDLLEIREKIWMALTPEQQDQARQRGPDYFDRYGDHVAIRRTNSHLRHFERNRTGSRAGARTMQMSVQMGGPVGGSWSGPSATSTMAMVGSATDEQMYGADRTRPTVYWRTQDQMLGALIGQVDVGPVETVRGQTPPKE